MTSIPFADDLGNKIFAIETNIQFIMKKVADLGVREGPMIDAMESIQQSLEDLKRLKQDIHLDLLARTYPMRND